MDRKDQHGQKKERNLRNPFGVAKSRRGLIVVLVGDIF